MRMNLNLPAAAGSVWGSEQHHRKQQQRITQRGVCAVLPVSPCMQAYGLLKTALFN
jgi:hypothetical protein